MALAVTMFVAADEAEADRLPLIRDAEIEDTIRQMATPLFRAAGLAPSSVSLYLVNDKSLNAFVAGGQRVYIHTGLLMRADNASQVIGVIAHETGHISGGHLSRIGGAADKAGAASLITTLIGAAAGIGTGRADVGAAIIAGGQGVAQRGFFSFTRAQEGSADQAALSLLDATGQSARGLLEFMQILEGQELLISKNQDPYVRTHPLSQDRIEAVQAHLARSRYSDARTDPNIEMAFERSKAKILGYFNPPKLTLRTIPETDQSIPARYARAFAYYRMPDRNRAIAALDSLLAELPEDPYFLELKAQVLFENGEVTPAIPIMRRAVEKKLDAPLFRFLFARMLTANPTPENLEFAVENLKNALGRDRRSPGAWRLLGVAYGKMGDIGRSSLALAEEALLLGRASEARFHAGRASETFPRGSAEWLQAEDLLLAAKEADK